MSMDNSLISITCKRSFSLLFYPYTEMKTIEHKKIIARVACLASIANQ